MQWSKPDFQEITLNMEVTAYVNTDGEVRKQQDVVVHGEANGAGQHESALE